MLLQTNSYVVPKEKRAEHERLMRRFRQALARLGCDQFEVYEQVGVNWSGGDSSGRFVQIMRFRDRKHQLAVQNAEKTDPSAQALINEFCALVNFEFQQQRGLFAIGFYNGVLGKRAAAGEAARPEGEVTETPQRAELVVDSGRELTLTGATEAGALELAPTENTASPSEQPMVEPPASEEPIPGLIEATDESFIIDDEHAETAGMDDELAELPPQEDELHFADDEINDLTLPHNPTEAEARPADNP